MTTMTNFDTAIGVCAIEWSPNGVLRLHLPDRKRRNTNAVDPPPATRKVIKQILKDRSLKAKKVVMIGDETRDIEAATKSGVGSIAVTWGFNSEDLLSTSNPDRILHSPEQLVQLFC